MTPNTKRQGLPYRYEGPPGLASIILLDLDIGRADVQWKTAWAQVGCGSSLDEVAIPRGLRNLGLDGSKAEAQEAFGRLWGRFEVALVTALHLGRPHFFHGQWSRKLARTVTYPLKRRDVRVIENNIAHLIADAEAAGSPRQARALRTLKNEMGDRQDASLRHPKSLEPEEDLSDPFIPETIIGDRSCP